MYTDDLGSTSRRPDEAVGPWSTDAREPFVSVICRGSPGCEAAAAIQATATALVGRLNRSLFFVTNSFKGTRGGSMVASQAPHDNAHQNISATCSGPARHQLVADPPPSFDG